MRQITVTPEKAYYFEFNIIQWDINNSVRGTAHDCAFSRVLSAHMYDEYGLPFEVSTENWFIEMALENYRHIKLNIKLEVNTELHDWLCHYDNDQWVPPITVGINLETGIATLKEKEELPE